eukprot:COSAG03_NODE_4535_length_1519_cov_13.961681_1_plen_43_part_10
MYRVSLSTTSVGVHGRVAQHAFVLGRHRGISRYLYRIAYIQPI